MLHLPARRLRNTMTRNTMTRNTITRNTMTKSIRLQIPTLSRLKLYPLFRGFRSFASLHRPQVIRWSLVGSFHTPILVIHSLALPFKRLQDTSRTRRMSVPTVPVVPTSVLQRETPGALLAHPHPCWQLASSLPVHAPAPANTTLVGSIVAPFPRCAACYNHFENWNLRFTDMELESESQLLNGLPPPIRRHQSQSYTLGTGVVDTHSKLTLARVFPLRFNATPLTAIRRMCPFLLNLTSIINTSLHPHRYPWNPTHVTRLLSPCITEHNKIHPAVQQTQRMQLTQQTQALQVSYIYAVPSIESYQHHQHRYQHQLFFHSHGPYHDHLHPTSFSDQPPETSNCAQIPIEPLYLPQYAHGPCMCGYHHTYV